MSWNRTALLTALVGLVTTIARAELFVPDLPSGSSYHLAFLTDGTYSAVLEFNADYDALVTEEVKSDPDLSQVEWRAIGSTAHSSATSYLDISGPIYRLDGVQIASRKSDLWDGSLDAPLNVTPSGASNQDVRVWTGSNRSGGSASCAWQGTTRECVLGLPDPSSDVMAGMSGATNSDWITGTEQRWTQQSRLYAISLELTVPESALPGDFDGNGVLDANDINLLTTQVKTGVYSSEYDLNTDLKVDGLDRDVWVEDLKSTYYGDSTLDGVFTTDDLVSVFAAGEYEDTVVGNSVWETGDWSGDMEFDTSDMVLAFQKGGYELGPRSAVSAVPEPAGVLSLLLGFASLVPFRAIRHQNQRQGNRA